MSLDLVLRPDKPAQVTGTSGIGGNVGTTLPTVDKTRRVTIVKPDGPLG